MNDNVPLIGQRLQCGNWGGKLISGKKVEDLYSRGTVKKCTNILCIFFFLNFSALFNQKKIYIENKIPRTQKTHCNIIIWNELISFLYLIDNTRCVFILINSCWLKGNHICLTYLYTLMYFFTIIVIQNIYI